MTFRVVRVKPKKFMVVDQRNRPVFFRTRLCDANAALTKISEAKAFAENEIPNFMLAPKEKTV